MAEHTPGPWMQRSRPTGKARLERQIYAGESDTLGYIAECYSPISSFNNYGGPKTVQEAEANAAFIVRACNSHDELVAMLEGVVTSYSRFRQR